MGCSSSSASTPGQASGPPQVFDEEELDGSPMPDSSPLLDKDVPSYWTNKRYVESGSFNQMVYVSREQQQVFDELMTSTYVPTSTRDRPCPKKTNPCDSQAQGCPCVQPDGNPGLPTGYRVRRVVRVENSAMWSRYVEKRDSIKSSREGEDLKRFRPETMPSQIIRKSPNLFHMQHWRLNEAYLWHGVDVRTALSIAQENFRIDLAGSSRGAMYGPGAYFAESCTKADEYTRDEPNGFYDGIRAMLLCRVTMGKMYYTTKHGQEEAFDKVSNGWCDSVLGDLTKYRMTFREFVVYNADQVYPEYVVLYSRLHRNDNMDDMQRLAKIPFYLELPVYWRNCHVAPRAKGFAQEFRVRNVTSDLLQRLVDASMASVAELRSVYRVENSSMWNRFVDFKARVRSSCNGRCAPPKKANVYTTKELKTHFAGEAISMENLEESLNEHLLWYGTSRETARGLAHGGINITDEGNGGRFGQGAYLSDNLDKALSYAAVEDGVKYVLLCRVCCGQLFEITGECADAHIQARSQGKHSVIGRVDQEPQVFVLLESGQVYPEFILELSEQPKVTTGSTDV